MNYNPSKHNQNPVLFNFASSYSTAFGCCRTRSKMVHLQVQIDDLLRMVCCYYFALPSSRRICASAPQTTKDADSFPRFSTILLDAG